MSDCIYLEDNEKSSTCPVLMNRFRWVQQEKYKDDVLNIVHHLKSKQIMRRVTYGTKYIDRI